MSRLVRLCAPWVLAALLLIILFSALRILIGDVLLSGAITDLDKSYAKSRQIAAGDLNAIHDKLEIARGFSMGDTEIDWQFVRWSLLVAEQFDIQPDMKQSILNEGLLRARRGVRTVPVLPYAWTVLLATKRARGEFDAEFRHALERATALGPWEPGLLVWQAEIALDAWDKLPPTERSIVQQIYSRGLLRNERQLQQVVSRHRNNCADSGGGCE